MPPLRGRNEEPKMQMFMELLLSVSVVPSAGAHQFLKGSGYGKLWRGT